MSTQALAIVPKTESGIAPRTLDEVMTLGDVFAKSGFFSDAKQAAQAVVKIIAGQELGISPMQAMMGIHIVAGKPMIGGDLLAKKVKASGRYDYKVLTLNDTVCDLEFYEHGAVVGHSTFSIEDARRAKTQNLDKFPRNMLFNRAISNGVRWFCPDVTTLTVYTPGEITDNEDALEIVELKPKPAPVAQLDIPCAPEDGKVTVQLADTPTQTEISQLWPKYGVKHGQGHKNAGQIMTLKEWLAQKHCKGLAELPAERALKLLDELRKRKALAENPEPGLATYTEAAAKAEVEATEAGAPDAQAELAAARDAAIKAGLKPADFAEEFNARYPLIADVADLPEADARKFAEWLRKYAEVKRGIN